MNLQLCRQKSLLGGVLLVTLFIGAAIGIALGSYLLLVRAQNVSVVRSQAWNSALAMAEAGAEEALAQLNPGALDKNISVDFTANGWGSPSGGIYGPKTRNMTNGYYSVAYSQSTFPIIYSTGYVTLPASATTLRRVIKIATTNVPLFNVSMAARTNIVMSGNGVSTDSYDSGNTNLSTNGRYDSTKAGTNGDVAILYGNLNLGNHAVQGDVFLGPTATMNGNTSQVSGNVYHDFNSDFPQVVLPTGSATWPNLTPLSGIIGGISYNYVFNTSGDYTVASINGSIYVNTNAHVRLKIAAGSISAIKVLGVGPTAGNLTLYVSASSFSLGGGGTVDGGVAANLAYYGLPSNTSISLAGNAAFTGTLYAPQANLTMSGGGSNDYDYMGTLVASSVTMTGHYMFHFDEDLLRNGATRGFVAVSWAEL
jgi:hypothetical protein